MKIASVFLITALSMFFIFPAYALDLKSDLIVPGSRTGPAVLGDDINTLIGTLGKPDFTKDNEDGSSLNEWGILDQTNANIPDAVLWVLVDNGKIIKAGTDGTNTYKTADNLGVGNTAADFVNKYGWPARNPAPMFFIFNNNLGISIQQDGTVRTVWVE